MDVLGRKPNHTDNTFMGTYKEYYGESEIVQRVGIDYFNYGQCKCEISQKHNRIMTLQREMT